MSTYEDIKRDAERDRQGDAEQSAAEFISETCRCAHDADAHNIVDDEDERGRYSWLECDDCGGPCEAAS